MERNKSFLERLEGNERVTVEITAKAIELIQEMMDKLHIGILHDDHLRWCWDLNADKPILAQTDESDVWSFSLTACCYAWVDMSVFYVGLPCPHCGGELTFSDDGLDEQILEDIEEAKADGTYEGLR